MMREELQPSTARRTLSATARLLAALQLDGPLLVGLGLICCYALIVQYSASGQSLDTVARTLVRIGLGALAMIALAHTSTNFLRRIAPWVFAAGVLLLVVVDAIGYVGKGAQLFTGDHALGNLHAQHRGVVGLPLAVRAAQQPEAAAGRRHVLPIDRPGSVEAFHQALQPRLLLWAPPVLLE